MYILASQSPRRKQLMTEDICQDFKIVVSNTDEHYPEELTDPKDIVRYIGRQKGEVIHEKYPGFTVISADTIVVLDNEIIGKPKDPEDAKRMLEVTGCDAVMIGRATLGNPWFIKECVEYLENNKIIDKPNDIEKVEMIKEHYSLLKKYSSEKQALLEIRTHALWYLKGIPGMKEYKNKLMQVKCEKEFFEILDEIIKVIS